MYAGRERIHQWWRPAEGSDPSTHAGTIQAGKPNVSFRKIVNTTLPDGSTLGVNAQLYAVLVMDVPDINRERRRCVTLLKPIVCSIVILCLDALFLQTVE